MEISGLRENDLRITPSLLDRLIDLDPRSTNEAPKSRLSGLADLKHSVRRDVEWLLNSRRGLAKIDENMEELNLSLAAYGLPDFTTLSIKNPDERDILTEAIESALEYFEPRLIAVKVTLEPFSDNDKQLTFRIEASLNVEPSPEPVVFDTVLQAGSGEFQVVEKS
jgi:type VI secretion system protein ImpF